MADVVSEAKEELAEVVEELATVAEELAEVVEKPAAAEKGERRRRKRRRRGGRDRAERRPDDRDRPEPSEPQIRREAMESAQAADELVDVDDVDVEETAPAAADEGGPPRERHARRHRERRGRGRDRQRPPADEPPPARDEVFDEDELEAVGALDEDLGDEHDEESSADARGVKIGFRNIPTWSEAIGTIVATNLESRVKRPGNDGPRGRGEGRGRQHRGHRGRKGPPDRRR